MLMQAKVHPTASFFPQFPFTRAG